MLSQRKVLDFTVTVLQLNFSSYVKKIAAAGIVRRNPKAKRIDLEDDFASDTNFTKNYKKEMRDTGNVVMEPDVKSIGTVYSEYLRDVTHLNNKIGRKKMMMKHYKEYIEKEVNLLTWAEKENIRYLHKSDPDEWNPENLSLAFPITPQGVEKLLKSTFRARTAREIQRHDTYVAERMQQIKTGKMDMTPELQSKLEIREKIPFNIGATAYGNEVSITIYDKPEAVGEFARLVTRKPKKDCSVRVEERENSQKLKQNRQHLKELNISSKEIMSLNEFESKLKSRPVENSPIKDYDKELQYLLKLEPNKENPVTAEMIRADLDPSTKHLSETDYINYNSIPKYDEKKYEDKVQLKIENGQAYLYNSEIGYQKPFSDDMSRDSLTQNGEDRIEVPQELKETGSVYRVGNSYYDENGSFMYRVI